MTAKTMHDMGGLAFLEGDPLGLRELEESLVWRTNGPLPDWLDSAEPDDEDDIVLLPPQTPESTSNSLPEAQDDHSALCDLAATALAFASLPAPPAKPIQEPAPTLGSLPEPLVCADLVETGQHSPLVPTPPEGLISIDEIHRFVEDSPVAPPQAPAADFETSPDPAVNAAAVARRSISFEELMDASLCLLTSVAGRLWAIPFDRIAKVCRPGDAAEACDLYERLEGKKRRDSGVAVVFDNEAILIVDRILGLRSLGWQPLPVNCDAPEWLLAQSAIGGESVGLVDWEALAATRELADISI